MSDATVRLDYDKIRANTADAYLLEFGDDNVWVPKSQISTIFEKKKVVHMSEWFAKKKGLI